MNLLRNRQLASLAIPHPLCLASLFLLALLAAWGCRPAASTSQPATTETVHASPVGADSSPQLSTPIDREFWELQQIAGARVGYSRTAIRTESRAGQRRLRVEGTSQMKFRRAGEEVEMGVEFSSIETLTGQLEEFNCTISQGAALIQKTSGRVDGDKMQLTITTQGKTVNSSIPWSSQYGGLIAGEQSLWQKPMQPGETRKLQSLVPGFNQVGTITLAAGDYEKVDLAGKTHELLRIKMTTTFAGGQSNRTTLWTDRTGDILCRREEAMNLESMRVSREVALAKSERAPFDLVMGLSVNVDRRIDHPHATKQIRYLLTLDGSNPAEVFPSGGSQAVKPLDANTAQVTVYAVRPDRPGNPDAPVDPPTDADRRPNNMIQSDNQAIVAMAEKVAADETDPWRVAVALEKHVREYIVSSDYSQAFATAAQVAESRKGDCTEHAVLLAALARARGIPARVAVGLVYTGETGQPAFAYHMWDEVYVADRWIPLDATVARAGIGAAHLKLAHTNLSAENAFTSFLPVSQVAGRLKVKIEAVEE